MIPLQLKLRNFLSYGSQVQTIDFEPHHLLCLSGKNGHGKSALLDALTWAIWGQARKVHGTPKADEGLLRLGQTHMMVTLDFLCNKKRYRVSREFVKQNKKAHTELSFGIADETGKFTSLNEKTNRATQQIIIDTVGLDYESCINSVFLRQGQANEFTHKSPQDRKEILANILGINRYEIIRKRALEKIRDASNAKEHLVQFIDQVNEEVHKKTEIQESYKSLKEELTELEQQEEILTKQTIQHEKEKQFLLEQQSKKTMLEFKNKQLSKSIEEKSTLLSETVTEWRTVRKQCQISQKTYSAKDKKQLEQQEENLEQKRTEQIKLKETLLEQKEQINTLKQTLYTLYTHEHQKLSTEHNKYKLELEKLNHISSESDKLKSEKLFSLDQYKKDFSELANKLTSFQNLDTKTKQEENSFERRKQFYHQFVARGNQLTSSLKNLHQKKDLGDSISAPSCPLCEQALSGARKRFLQNKLAHQGHFYTHQLNRLKQVIPALKTSLVTQHATLDTYKKQYVEKTRITDQQNSLLKQIEQLSKELQELTATHNTCLKELQKLNQITEQSFKKVEVHETKKDSFVTENLQYKKLETSYKKTSAEFKSCNYDPVEHATIKKQLNQINQQRDQATELLQQISLQKKRKQDFHILCIAIRALKKEHHLATIDYAEYKSLETEQKELENKIRDQLDKQKILTDKKGKLLQEKGAQKQQLKLFEQREKELTKYTKQIEQYDTDIDEYQVIAQALSKNGIQAFLIENALPEIEHEANQLLSKLTDNQSHIIIESLRDLKSGGTKETLEIKISDALGIRPYELFSGGEAFRIDFALRIAISKLLARRSGTSLQTLIIDEGFGSQDDEGLANIMEALYKIQNDFAKIIIVSHLPTMKSQFPTHFFIQKSANGSHVTVIEQG